MIANSTTIHRRPLDRRSKKDVLANRPYTGGSSYEDCLDMFNSVVSGRAEELVGPLKYERPTAEEILAGALAHYLDERFTVTNRRQLGWT